MTPAQERDLLAAMDEAVTHARHQLPRAVVEGMETIEKLVKRAIGAAWVGEK